MKSEWEFTYQARDCHLEREHKYLVTSREPVDLDNARLEPFESLVKVSPTAGETPPGVEQIGTVTFTLPLAPDLCKDFAYHFAGMAVDRLAFHYRGDIRLAGGLVRFKRLPETPEEEAAVGDRPYGITLHFIEVVPSPSVESLAGSLTAGGPIDPRLLGQFLETERDASPIRKFLGFFRIVENFVHRANARLRLKEAMKRDQQLRRFFEQLAPGQMFDEFVDTIVEIRHKCAHLKLGRGFGFVPTDPEVERTLAPHLPLLEELARACVAGA
jgi:hypothetical protein